MVQMLNNLTQLNLWHLWECFLPWETDFPANNFAMDGAKNRRIGQGLSQGDGLSYTFLLFESEQDI